MGNNLTDRNPGNTSNLQKGGKKFSFEVASKDASRPESQRSDDSSHEETQRVLNNEIKILKTLNHPNIIKYHESFVDKKK